MFVYNDVCEIYIPCYKQTDLWLREYFLFRDIVHIWLPAMECQRDVNVARS